MSILAAEEIISAREIVVVTIWLCVAGLILLIGGVWRPASVNGPSRILPGQSAIGALMAAVVGFVAWFGLQVAYGVYVASQRIRDGTFADFDPAKDLTPLDFAFLTIAPPVMGLLALLVGDLMAKPALPARLGYVPNRVPRGVLIGTVGIIAIYPLVVITMIAAEIFYRSIEYQHPSEHELLTIMLSAPPPTKAIIIIGAALFVPMFEEVFFRGHVQSILRRWIGMAWPAIFITSAVFAIVHPLWSAPGIFVLAVGLGYLYERTGNLWACVIAHAIFNGYNTWYFLYFAKAH